MARIGWPRALAWRSFRTRWGDRADPRRPQPLAIPSPPHRAGPRLHTRVGDDGAALGGLATILRARRRRATRVAECRGVAGPKSAGGLVDLGLTSDSSHQNRAERPDRRDGHHLVRFARRRRSGTAIKPTRPVGESVTRSFLTPQRGLRFGHRLLGLGRGPSPTTALGAQRVENRVSRRASSRKTLWRLCGSESAGSKSKVESNRAISTLPQGAACLRGATGYT